METVAACSSGANVNSGGAPNESHHLHHGPSASDRLEAASTVDSTGGSHARAGGYAEEEYEQYEGMEFHEPQPALPEIVAQQHSNSAKPVSSAPSGVARGGQGGTTRPLILRVVKEASDEGSSGEKSIKQEVVLKPVLPEFETILEYDGAEGLEEGQSEEEARKEASRISQELLNGLVVYYVRPIGQSGSPGQEPHAPPSRGGEVTSSGVHSSSGSHAGTMSPIQPAHEVSQESDTLAGSDSLETVDPMSPVGTQQSLIEEETDSDGKKAKYVCHLCKRHFTAGTEHRYHMRTFHNATAGRPCPICSKPFYNTTDLRNHVMAHKGVKPYKCQICGHAFTVKSNLTNHLLRHGPLEYECQICGKRLAQPASLKKHLKSHAGNRPFQCSLCDKRFLQRGDLTRHQLVHNGQRDFPCDLCDKQFSLKANLQTHRRKVHGQDNMNLMS